MTLCSALLITRCRHGAVEVEMSFIKVPGAGNIAHLKILRTPFVTCWKFLCIGIKATISSVLHKSFLLLCMVTNLEVTESFCYDTFFSSFAHPRGPRLIVLCISSSQRKGGRSRPFLLSNCTHNYLQIVYAMHIKVKGNVIDIDADIYEESGRFCIAYWRWCHIKLKSKHANTEGHCKLFQSCVTINGVSDCGRKRRIITGKVNNNDCELVSHTNAWIAGDM